jgi:PhnB protein
MYIQPYLFFDGRCEEAIACYQKAIGATVVMMMRFGEAPQDAQCGPDGVAPPADKIMHSALQVGDSLIMASDGFARGKPEFKGTSLSLTAKDDAEARRLFDALADGGRVEQPMTPTFFASSFGMLVDRFGVSWMVIKPNEMPA